MPALVPEVQRRSGRSAGGPAAGGPRGPSGGASPTSPASRAGSAAHPAGPGPPRGWAGSPGWSRVVLPRGGGRSRGDSARCAGAPQREGRRRVRARSGRMRPVTSSGTAPREVTVLGSTGSIGRQAIAVAGQNPDRLRITGLAAGGGDVGPARRAGAGPRRAHGRRRPGDRGAGPAAGPLRRGRPARLGAGQFALPEILAGPRAAEELAARPADVVLNGITGSIGLGPDAGRAAPPGAPSRWPTRSRSSPAVRWSPPRPRPASSCRSTPSTRRWPSACAAARAARSPGWCSPPAAARSAAARPPSWPTSPPSRPWRTRPGGWVRSSRSTRRPWSTRAWS